MVKYKQINSKKDLSQFQTFELRQADIDELYAATGLPPLAAIGFILDSKCSNGWAEIAYEFDTKEILSMFGLNKVNGLNAGIPWMIASPNIIKYKKILMRYSKKVIEKMLKEVPILYNYVDNRNVVHIHWLKHMGFTIDNHSMLLRGVKFQYFYKYKEK